jgi:hypothetical protein
VNTFALIALAFPFYLAINGRLTAYTALATTAAPTTATPAAGEEGTVPQTAVLGAGA